MVTTLSPTQLRARMAVMAEQMTDVIVMGAGDPDFSTPAHIVEAAQAAVGNGRANRVLPPAGLPELREAIAHKLRTENKLPVERDNILVTTGGQEGVFLIWQALLDPGDEVILPDPCYPTYDECIERAGGRCVWVPTDHDDAFNLKPERVEAAITPKTKAILIVTPGNPTSGIVTEDRLRAIADIAIRHNLIVVSDELYEQYVYAPYHHFSIGSLPGMAERTITLCGFSKSYIMTGFRVGYLAAPKNFIDALIPVKALASGQVAAVSQYAALVAITGSQAPTAEFKRQFTERRAVMVEGLRKLGVNLSEPRGAYYLWFDPSPLGFYAPDLAYKLLDEARVLVYPSTGFGANWIGYLRMSLLQPVPLLEEALARMKPIIDKHRRI
jgi:aminotransferase